MRGSARRVGQGAAPALQPGGPDREERGDDQEDRHDGAGRVRHRLLRAPAAAAWRQQVQQTGSGDNAVVTKVTWTGGNTPTGEDSLFQFLAQPASSTTYTFSVQQTYSDGSIVNWSGPESSDAPTPTIEVKDSLGGRGCVGVDDHRADHRCAGPRGRRVRPGQRVARESGRCRRERPAGGSPGRPARWRSLWRGRCRSASAHAYLIKTSPAASVVLDAPPPNVQLTYDEAVEPRLAIISVTNAHGQQETTGPVHRSPGEPGHAGGAVAASPAGGLVPDLLAGDLGRRSPGVGRVHLRGRSEPRAGAPVPGAEHLGDGGNATAA